MLLVCDLTNGVGGLANILQGGEHGPVVFPREWNHSTVLLQCPRQDRTKRVQTGRLWQLPFLLSLVGGEVFQLCPYMTQGTSPGLLGS